MSLLNENNLIGIVLKQFTINTTGSEFGTFYVVWLLLFLTCIAFKIPPQIAFILLFPLILGLMAYSGAWVAVAGLGLIYMAFLFVYWLFGR